MNRVVHFEIQVDSIARAAKFYTDVFGRTIAKRDDPSMEYWMVMISPIDSKEPGINGGMILRTGSSPAQECGTNSFVCTIEVDDFDAYASKIVAEGGAEVMPKFMIGDMAVQGYFKDTEGNTFGLHQAIKG